MGVLSLGRENDDTKILDLMARYTWCGFDLIGDDDGGRTVSLSEAKRRQMHYRAKRRRWNVGHPLIEFADTFREQTIDELKASPTCL